MNAISEIATSGVLSNSAARSMRWAARYCIGGASISRVNAAANADRDIPTLLASSTTDQRTARSAEIRRTALKTWGDHRGLPIRLSVSSTYLRAADRTAWMNNNSVRRLSAAAEPGPGLA